MPPKKQSMPRRPRASSRPTGLVARNDGPLGFPDRTSVRLQYSENGQVTSALSSVDRVWNLNSGFDPDVTGAGHQPRQWDSWTGIYARYIITRTDVELSVRQRAAHGIGVVVVPTNGATALTAAGYPAELRRASRVVVTSSNQPPAAHRATYLPHAVTGVTEAVYRADDRFQASIGASPTESICLHTFVYSLDGATAIDYEYTLLMTFHVEFFDLVNPGISLVDSLTAARRAALQAEDRDEFEVVRVRRAAPK